MPAPQKRRAKETQENTEVDSFSPTSTVSKKPTHGGSLRKVGLAVCFACAMSAAIASPAAAATGQQYSQIEQLDEKAEQKILKESDSHGQIVRLNEGKPGKGIHLSIHGLGANPGDMAPVTNRAEAKGQATATFAYDDFHGEQGQNAQALASELKGWLAEHPGEKVTIETHSLGGRMILAAFQVLQKDGEMPTNSIRLSMISPPLAGFGLFNIAMPLGPLAKLIPGAAATRDMATMSGAQSSLETVRLPDNVQTKIFYGDNDSWIDYTTKGAKKMAENLNAQVYYLAGEHTTTVPTVAKHRPEDFSTTPLEYKPGKHNNNRQFGPRHH